MKRKAVMARLLTAAFLTVGAGVPGMTAPAAETVAEAGQVQQAERQEEAQAEPSQGEPQQKPTEGAPEETGQESSEAAPEETGQESSEAAPEETGQAPSEAAPEETGQAPSEAVPEETEQEPSEDMTEETGQEPSEETTEETGQEPSEEMTEETGQEPSEEMTEETGQEPTEEMTEETGQESSTEEVTEEIGTETSTEEETQAEVFTKGYAYAEAKTAVYGSREQTEAARIGSFSARGVVYVLERFGDGASESEWMRILFAAGTDQEDIKEGYVRAEVLKPLTQEQASELLAEASAAGQTVLWQGTESVTLTVCGFEASAPEETEAAETGAENGYRIEASWEKDTLGIGDMLTLTAADAGTDAVVWQYLDEDGSWQEFARGASCTYELTMENYKWICRAVEADALTDSEVAE